MDRLGYLERRLAERGRGIGLHLTPTGARARAHGHEVVEAFEAQLADTLEPARQQRLVKLLEETRTILSESEPVRPRAR